ncbi:hypothetical protein V8C86DRAFT_970840 [Haematococcus lacustris]
MTLRAAAGSCLLAPDALSLLLVVKWSSTGPVQALPPHGSLIEPGYKGQGHDGQPRVVPCHAREPLLPILEPSWQAACSLSFLYMLVHPAHPLT